MQYTWQVAQYHIGYQAGAERVKYGTILPCDGIAKRGTSI